MEAFENVSKVKAQRSSVASTDLLQQSFDRAARRDAARRADDGSQISGPSWERPRPSSRPLPRAPPPARIALQYNFAPPPSYPRHEKEAGWPDASDEKVLPPAYVASARRATWWRHPVAIWTAVGLLVLLFAGIAAAVVTKAHASTATDPNSAAANDGASQPTASSDNDAPPIISTPMPPAPPTTTTSSARSTRSSAAPVVSQNPLYHKSFYGIGCAAPRHHWPR
jgi:hypothetical protein